MPLQLSSVFAESKAVQQSLCPNLGQIFSSCCSKAFLRHTRTTQTILYVSDEPGRHSLKDQATQNIFIIQVEMNQVTRMWNEMYQSKEKNTEGAITAMGVIGNTEQKKARLLLNEEPGLHEITSVVELFYNSQRKPEHLTLTPSPFVDGARYSPRPRPTQTRKAEACWARERGYSQKIQSRRWHILGHGSQSEVPRLQVHLLHGQRFAILVG